MISERKLLKLKNKILFILYDNYNRTNEVSLDDITLSGLLVFGYNKYRNTDSHDFYLALRSLVANGFITVDFKEHEKWDNATLTSSGIKYCQSNKDNKFIKYLKTNHLAIIAIIISVIALFCK